MNGDAGLGMLADEASTIARGLMETSAVLLGLVVLVAVLLSRTARRRLPATWTRAWIVLLAAMPLASPVIYGWARGASIFLFVLTGCLVGRSLSARLAPRTSALVLSSACALMLCTVVQAIRVGGVASTTAPELWSEFLLYDLCYELSLPLSLPRTPPSGASAHGRRCVYRWRDRLRRRTTRSRRTATRGPGCRGPGRRAATPRTGPSG